MDLVFISNYKANGKYIFLGLFFGGGRHRVSLESVWARACYVNQVASNFICLCLPSAGLKAYTTTPSLLSHSYNTGYSIKAKCELEY